MRYDVSLTQGAERDLEEIYSYLQEYESTARSDLVLDGLLDVAERLSRFPERGSFPRELLALGIREYRQVFFESYRLIYRLIGDRVFVYLIADGRRDMQSLLQRRLLGA